MADSTSLNATNTSPKILIMGAGAIGAYFGAKLARLYPTWFVARGAHLEAMKQHGIRINSIHGDMLEHPNYVEDPSTLDTSFDLIIFSVKSYDTPKAIEQIRPVVSDKTIILSLQNGIENVGQLNEAFSPEQVIPATANIGVMVTEPGLVEHSAYGLVTFGTTATNTNKQAIDQIYNWMQSAEINIKISERMTETIWKKFTWNSVFNMTTGLLNITTDQLWGEDSEEIPPICRMLFKEIQEAARLRDGIELEDDYLQAIVDRTRSMGAFKTSTYQDRQKGKPLEYEAFTGAIVRIGQRYNKQFPNYEMLHEMYKIISRTG